MRRGSRERREGDGLAPSKGSNALLCICMPPAACRRWVRAVFDSQHGSAWEGRRGLLVLRLQARVNETLRRHGMLVIGYFFCPGWRRLGLEGADQVGEEKTGLCRR